MKASKIDRLSDQFRLRRHVGLLNEARKPDERRGGAVGMHGGDAARMAGIPGLEQSERLGAADFTDDDPVRARAHRGAGQEGQVGGGGRVKLHHVGRVALKLAGVLDDDEALVVSARA